MTKVFISYRNGDGAYAAALIDERLSHVLGPEEVFRASRSIMPGDSYSEAIMRALKECETLLVVVGPGWAVSLADGSGSCGRGDDWVRIEIATAIENGSRVIPVLISGADPLDKTLLPPDVAALADKQYLRFGHRSIDTDMAGLLAAVNRPQRSPDVG